jgi:hypothetical protein
MRFVQLLILYACFASLLFMIIGLFKPWAMLWWEDVQSRRKIIKVYGSLSAFFALAYFILKLF